jgi:hypothetical protein
MGKFRRLIVTLIATLVGLLSVGAASAGDWYYRADGSFGWLGPGHYDASCVWYYGQASCSGWNYWSIVSINRDEQNGTILLGFENHERIRGVYVAEDQASRLVTPGELSMPRYSIAHGTWWFGEDVFLRLHAQT